MKTIPYIRQGILVCGLLFVLSGTSLGQTTPIQGDKLQSQVQKSSPDLRGTEQSPLVVQPLPTKKEPEEFAREVKDKSDSDWWTLHLGILTLGALSAQVILLFFQFYFLWGTLKATANAANAAVESVAIQESLERPRIMISKIHCTEIGNGYDLAYAIENFGNTPAILQQSSFDLRILSDLPTPPKYESIRNWRDRILYGRGTIGNDSDDPLVCVYRPLSEPQNMQFAMLGVGDLEGGARGTELYFYGFIKFLDVFNKTRKTGFCYQIDPVFGNMTRAGGEEYNYDVEEN